MSIAVVGFLNVVTTLIVANIAARERKSLSKELRRLKKRFYKHERKTNKRLIAILRNGHTHKP